MQVVDCLGQDGLTAIQIQCSFISCSCYSPTGLCRSMGRGDALSLLPSSTHRHNRNRKERAEDLVWGIFMVWVWKWQSLFQPTSHRPHDYTWLQGEAGRCHIAVCPTNGLGKPFASFCHANWYLPFKPTHTQKQTHKQKLINVCMDIFLIGQSLEGYTINCYLSWAKGRLLFLFYFSLSLLMIAHRVCD